MLGQIVQDLPETVSGRLLQTLEEVVHHTRELKDSVMSMRAQPVGAVFQRMPRLVRELATKTSKKVRLEMAGENTEVDRSIVEQLADPLHHHRYVHRIGIQFRPDGVRDGSDAGHSPHEF
jgi:two-component system chemotaxis sensor kinase CheA